MMTFWFYNIVVTVGSFLIGPFMLLFFLIRGSLDGHFGERLGLLTSKLVPAKGERQRIWVHAVSVGEVKLARVIARVLQERKGDFSLVVSTTTPTGRKTASKEMPRDSIIVYNPLDLWWCVKRSLQKISPDLFIGLETEIWPNLLWACKELNIPAVLINGRISVRSIDYYRRLRFLMKDVLSVYTLLSMISRADAERILSMGAARNKIVVTGNAKYDLLIDEARPELSDRIRRVYKIKGKRPVFIAGSTRGGEEEIILDVFIKLLEKYPDAILIVVPRHIERSKSIASLIRSRNLEYCLRSSLDNVTKRDGETSVILVDKIGELFGLYSLGSVIFCGASLVPLGGQNVLEAAVWGKPVMYGPWMENFPEATALLEGVGAGLRVRDGHELLNTATWLLENPAESHRLGGLARNEIEKYIGSARKHIGDIFRFIDEES
jgi:3-deoxy-D-manno-octulosonic-acid transferase